MIKQISFFIVVLLTLTVGTFAQDKKAKGEAKEVTITGEVIDVKCYTTGMMGGKGEDHKQCAIDCIKGGLPVGILEDKTDKVYLVVPKKGMQGANDALVGFAAKKVRFTGTVAEKGGMKLLLYTSFEEVK